MSRDPRNLEDYRACLSWGPKRWAWELLRRNSEYLFFFEFFRHSDKNERREAARRFGLEDLIDPALSVGLPKEDQPHFTDRRVKYVLNDRQDVLVRKTVGLEFGDVVIRVNLRAALTNKAVLGKKLAAVESVLKKSLNRLVGTRARELRITGGVATLIEVLRTLELLELGVPHAEIALTLWPEDFKHLARVEVSQRVETRISKARAYVDRDYRKVAVWETEPFKESQKKARRTWGSKRGGPGAG